MVASVPRILSPNLGCPFILSPEDLQTKGIDIVTAEEDGLGVLSLIARPSYPGEGEEFALDLQGKEELIEDTLPSAFGRIEETRFLLSTPLRSSLFERGVKFFRYQARITSSLGPEVLRQVGSQPRLTLYDLFLKKDGQRVSAAFHALSLRPAEKQLRFIHLTDLHVALRNDLYEANLGDNVSYLHPGEAARIHFNNFNENLRRFIRYANNLADRGELDFVLMLGDLVDCLGYGFSDREDLGENNCRVFRDLILGGAKEGGRPVPNPGLKVPIFTSTGNHDWRTYPYDVAMKSSVFGVEKKVGEQLDLFWSDEQEEITCKIKTTYERLVNEGSFISNRTWLGWLINVGLNRLQKWQVQLLTPLSASAIIGFLAKIPRVGGFLERILGTGNPILVSLVTLILVPIVLGILVGVLKRYVRKRVTELLAINAGWRALKDYFLTINPYFNYAFRLGHNYFLILDSGHDCLRAQYLWDDGDKKLGPLSISDNMIGGSPDTMAFYDINEYYPYSQISWMDRLLQLISREAKSGEEPVRILVGLHAPPANLSLKNRQRVARLAADLPTGLLLPEGKFNIRYGGLNHYLSQFLHLCLGRIERDPTAPRYPLVDVVLAGHAHWKLEFRLEWDEERQRPTVYCGDFTSHGDQFQQNFARWRPFLLQTPAAGPREEFSPEPPYFRRMEIDGQGKVTTAEVLALRADGTTEVPKLLS